MICELTNMCMITAPDGRVLVQHRLPKPTNPWCGLTFPGGHVEPEESIVTSVVREIQEETGLTLTGTENCGYIQWYNPEKQSQYIVFLFKSSSFTGSLKSSAEGRMEWMTLDDMRAGQLAPNMKKYLEVFCNDDVLQAYGVSGTYLTAVPSQNSSERPSKEETK